MTLLAMLRHGDTEWSREGRIQGRTDVPLCETGRAKLGNSVLPEEFREMRVVTSPLTRCVETASLLGVEQFERDHRLTEMRWGTWEGRRLDELRSELGDEMRDNEARGFDFTPPGGESPRIVLERVSRWLADVAEDGRPTLAIAHRGVIRVVFAAAANWNMRIRPPVKLKWDAMHVFRLERTGAPKLFLMNVPLGEKRADATAT